MQPVTYRWDEAIYFKTNSVLKFWLINKYKCIRNPNEVTNIEEQTNKLMTTLAAGVKSILDYVSCPKF